MIKKSFRTHRIAVVGVALSLVLSEAVLAEDLPEGKVKVRLEFASGNTFRGGDTFANRYAQRQESLDSYNAVPVFLPYIEFKTPLEGLTFSMAGRFGMNNRRDRDVDGVLQTSPGGDDILEGKTGAAQYAAIIDELTLDSTCTSPSCTDPQTATALYELVTGARSAPAYYDEKVGLGRSDQVKYQIAYSRKTTAGSFGGGFYTKEKPNADDKKASTEEMFVWYAMPFLPELKFSAYAEVSDDNANSGAGSYFAATYATSAPVNDWLAVLVSVNVGYAVLDHARGIQDVTTVLGLKSFGFFVKAHHAYRPDLRLHEPTYESGNRSQSDAPLWLIGESTLNDGQVADAGRASGKGDYYRAINSDIEAFLDATNGNLPYTYTPRQKIPRYMWWFSIGYEFEL